MESKQLSLLNDQFQKISPLLNRSQKGQAVAGIIDQNIRQSDSPAKLQVTNPDKAKVRDFMSTLARSDTEEKQILDFLSAWIEHTESKVTTPLSEKYLVVDPVKSDFKLDPMIEGGETLDLILGDDKTSKFLVRINTETNQVGDREVKLLPLDTKNLSMTIKDTSGNVMYDLGSRRKQSLTMEDTDRDYILEVKPKSGKSFDVLIGDLLDLLEEIKQRKNTLNETRDVATLQKSQSQTSSNQQSTQEIMHFMNDLITKDKITRAVAIDKELTIPEDLRVENNTVKTKITMKNLALQNLEADSSQNQFAVIKSQSPDEAREIMQKLQSELFVDKPVEGDLEVSLYTLDNYGEPKQKVDMEQNAAGELIAKIPEGERFGYTVKFSGDKSEGISWDQSPVTGNVYLVNKKLTNAASLGKDMKIPTNLIDDGVDGRYTESFSVVRNQGWLKEGIQVHSQESGSQLKTKLYPFIANQADDSKSAEDIESNDRLNIHIGKSVYDIPNKDQSRTVLVENQNHASHITFRTSSDSRAANINLGELIETSAELGESPEYSDFDKVIPIKIEVLKS